MALDNLRAFLGAIDTAGALVRVDHPVSVNREMTEIADRCMKSPGGGPALLFEHPTLVGGGRSRQPVAVNLFGSERRMALALGVDCLDEIGERIAALLNLKVPDTLLGKLAMLPQLAEVAKFPPKAIGGRAPSQKTVLQGAEVNLAELPIPICWPEDGGPYITLAGVITRDPKSGVRNVGMYRVQVIGKNEVAMHWQRHKVGAAHWRELAARGETMPVAIALGGDPASIYAASAPLPPSIDEFLFAGFLRREPVRLAKAVTCDLEVPAEAELVLEGYIDPREPLVLEGPFGDHTGFYSLADHYPKVHITAVTLRDDPIYPHTIVGRPPMEDYYLGHATERIFLPLLKLTLPEIVDIHMPAEGIFHNLVFVSIDKQYPGQAYKVMNGLWGQGLMSLAKVIIVVDKDVNVRDPKEAWWVALNHIDPERDVRFTMGPIDVLDHSSRGFTFGSKMGIDATRKWKEEGFAREWPNKIVMDEATKRRVDEMWKELGIEL
ncbi:MAG: menaquinone biosynthesis decarboxylase [Gemmatimonadetes bacterium]|nr:MAG: menaquinone biosynthesis decarboxylase [Gemmatimonadota bacterium]PYP32764.1 MAG: menaquinone biosynthesis decarboxylase [Gemmatimonadota bacterium]